jgi:hypothetical protein
VLEATNITAVHDKLKFPRVAIEVFLVAHFAECSRKGTRREGSPRSL